MSPSPELLAISAPVIFVAYAVFGMTGFGAAMVAVPMLVQVVPLQVAVPLVVLFDLVTTALVGGKNWSSVAKLELKCLLPSMLIGIAIGVVLLHNVGPRWPLVGLGLFVLGVSVRNLVVDNSTKNVQIPKSWSLPFGMAGGVFSALFGTGGPIYTIYLSRRLSDVNRFRATIAVVILLSGISRAVAFGAAGLYGKDSILELAIVLLPMSLLGLFVGSRARTRFSAIFLKRLVLLLLSVAGLGAIYRGLVATI
jgi:uncharacterized membrane protein YfcA